MYQKRSSLPSDKFLDWLKSNAFADDKINVTEKNEFVLGKVENIVRKGENTGYQHFLLFPQGFQKASFSKVVKSRDCVIKGRTITRLQNFTLVHTDNFCRH